MKLAGPRDWLGNCPEEGQGRMHMCAHSMASWNIKDSWEDACIPKTAAGCYQAEVPTLRAQENDPEGG